MDAPTGQPPPPGRRIDAEANVAVTNVGLVVHGGRPEAAQAAGAVRQWCAGNAVRCTDLDVWSEGGRRSAREEMRAAGRPDLIVTLGGDGTFLRGARLAAKNDALVLGVDVGRVGFLTEVPAARVRAALDAVHQGRFETDDRMLLAVRASRRLQVPSGLRTAALALGLTRRQSLVEVELPLAMPTILAGVKTAAVMSVGTATSSTSFTLRRARSTARTASFRFRCATRSTIRSAFTLRRRKTTS